MFPFCQPCTHAYRSSSSFNTTRWYSLFLFMWLWWRFQEGSSGPMGLVAVWPSADHCCGQRGRPCWKENLPWMDGVQLKQESSSWQPLLNKHGMMWWRTKGTHTLIFIHFPLPLICFSWCHLWVEIYISEEVFLYFFSQIPLLSLSFFLSPSLIFVAFFHQCTYQFLSPAGFKGSLCAASSQSDPSSDKYSFQRPFTGNEPISGFSRLLLAGNLSCKTCVSVCQSN